VTRLQPRGGEQPATQVRLAAFDVDGVLTDGRIILGPHGDEYKAFHVRDGHGLVRLRESGVALAVITGRQSAVVDCRMRELGITHVYQGVRDKRAQLLELLDVLAILPTHTCYVGDDLPDLGAMRIAGLPVAVADACPEVIAAAAWVTTAAGGHGAVREVCDAILRARSDGSADSRGAEA
jgi:3-deoxy-D-manno-octulosonate 8-phosphate phosphatase (KDO 8-P phosphatase)